MGHLYQWFHDRAVRQNQIDRPFLVMSDGAYITFGQFLERVKNNNRADGYRKLNENFSIVVPVDYSIETLIDIFSLLKEGKSVLVTNPKQYSRNDIYHFANGNHNPIDKNIQAGRYDVVYSGSKTNIDSIWMSSSGVTKKPIYWSHNHESLGWNIDEYCDAFNLDETSFFWPAFPPHSIAFWKSIFVLANCAGRVLFNSYPIGMDAVNIFNTINNHAITSLAFPPIYAEVLIALHERGVGTFEKSLKRVLCGGDYLADKTYHEFVHRFRIKPNIIYGSTESAGVITYVNEEDWAPGNIGKMLKGNYSIEGGGSRGRLILEGGFLSKCLNGKYTTNDIVDISQGYLRYIGRSNDIVTFKGQRISLIEIEEEILKNENVKAARVYVELDEKNTLVQIDSRLCLEVVLVDRNRVVDKNEILSKLNHKIEIDKILCVDKITRHSSTKIVRTS